MSLRGETSHSVAKCQPFSQSISEPTFTCMTYTPQLMASLGVGCPLIPPHAMSFFPAPLKHRTLNWFIINPWKDDDESYECNENHYVNCGVKNYMKVDHHSTVIDATFAVFFFRLSFRNCSVVILNPADTISYEISVAPSAIIDIQCIYMTCTCMHVFPRDKPFFLCNEHNSGKIKINRRFKHNMLC